MYVRRIQWDGKNLRVNIPRRLFSEAGWLPGIYVLIEVRDPETIIVHKLGGTVDEAAQAIAAFTRQHRTSQHPIKEPD